MDSSLLFSICFVFVWRPAFSSSLGLENDAESRYPIDSFNACVPFLFMNEKVVSAWDETWEAATLSSNLNFY